MILKEKINKSRKLFSGSFKKSFIGGIVAYGLATALSFGHVYIITGCGNGVTCIDKDNDRFYSNPGCGTDVDCNDDDPNNWYSCIFCEDVDGDNAYNNCDAYVSINGPDCDDNDSSFYPGATEKCDRVDNNCDKNIDEGCLPSGLTGKIAFYSYHEIYVMDADGSNKTRLTFNPGWDWHPTWSPDGSMIAFQSFRDGNWEIYIMNADGSNLTNITNHPEHDHNPAWSPDGSKIAFKSTRDGVWDIYVMNVDGSNPTNLTNDSSRYYGDPAWSPDGNKIAYVTTTVNGYEIYVMDADGSNQTRLTFSDPTKPIASLYSEYPAWSPDGSKIAFDSNIDGSPEIYVMDADGSNQTKLTFSPGTGRYPAWSPDGTKIAFMSFRDDLDGYCIDNFGTEDCNFEIYVMNADGSNQTNITNSPDTYDSDPAWTQ